MGRRTIMIEYATLENVSKVVLFETFMKTADNFRIKDEANLDMFCEMLLERDYDPAISVGAFDTETGEMVSFVLNSILKDDKKTAYDILTGTVPDYRRKGISRAIFEKVKTILKEKQVELYTTEVKRNNTIAWNLYQSLGFEIKKEVVTIINTPHGSREVEQYEIMMKI